MSTGPEQRLWQNVLLTVLADLQSSSEYKYRDREFARSWVGDYPSRDFRVVCDLAGIDAKATHRYLQQFCGNDQPTLCPSLNLAPEREKDRGRKAL